MGKLRPFYGDYAVGRLFARYGMAGWWKLEYETTTGKEVVADLQRRGAPASPLLNRLRTGGS